MLNIKIRFVMEGKEVPVDSFIEALVQEVPLMGPVAWGRGLASR